MITVTVTVTANVEQACYQVPLHKDIHELVRALLQELIALGETSGDALAGTTSSSGGARHDGQERRKGAASRKGNSV